MKMINGDLQRELEANANRVGFNTKPYRLLKEGEIVLETDEILNDHGDWQPVQGSIGQAAPNPLFTSHRKFRRWNIEQADD